MHQILHWARAVGFVTLAFLYSLAITAFIVLAPIGLAAALSRFVSRKAQAPGSDAPRLRGLMKRMARQTLLLAPAKTSTVTKLGGDPELPPGHAWPEGVKGPRAFLAQIDLNELRAAEGPDWLPEEGLLYAFYDEWRAGFPDEVAIIFSHEAPGPPLAPPEALPPKWRFAERRTKFLSFQSTPSLDWLGIDPAEVDLNEQELDELADAPDEPFGDELQHRIGGYPSEIQGTEMRLECEYLARGLTPGQEEPSPAILRASRSWRLLLQIDTDPGLGMTWGDGGRLYVFVREAHAKRGDFSRTVTISQCD